MNDFNNNYKNEFIGYVLSVSFNENQSFFNVIPLKLAVMK